MAHLKNGRKLAAQSTEGQVCCAVQDAGMGQRLVGRGQQLVSQDADMGQRLAGRRQQLVSQDADMGQRLAGRRQQLVSQDADMGQRLVGGDSSWCPELESRMAHTSRGLLGGVAARVGLKR